MSQAKKEVVVRLNHKTAVITNCPPTKYLTCEVPIRPVGALRVDRKDRWMCTGVTDETDACVEENIDCDHVDDMETPMMPVFLPGLLAAPPTNRCVPMPEDGVVVEELIYSQRVKDTETANIPIGCHGVAEPYVPARCARVTKAAPMPNMSSNHRLASSSRKSKADMMEEQQPSAIWRNPILQQNDAYSHDIVDGSRSSKLAAVDAGAFQNDTFSPTVSTSAKVTPTEARSRNDGINSLNDIHCSLEAVEAEVLKPQQRVRNKPNSLTKVNIKEIMSQFEELLLLDDSNVIVSDSHSESFLAANPVSETAVIPLQKTQADNSSPSLNKVFPCHSSSSATDSRGMTGVNSNTHEHQNTDFQYYLNGNHKQHVCLITDQHDGEPSITAPSNSSSNIDSQLNSMMDECTAYIDDQLNRPKY